MMRAAVCFIVRYGNACPCARGANGRRVPSEARCMTTPFFDANVLGVIVCVPRYRVLTAYVLYVRQ